MLNIYPDNISTNLIVPLSHEKTLTIFEWFFHDVASEKNRARIKRSVASVTKCSRKILASAKMSSVDCARRPMTADATPSGRENGVHHFHMLLGEFLGQP